MPLLGFVNAAALSLLNQKLHSGVVLSIGHNIASVAAVWRGEVFTDFVRFLECETDENETTKKRKILESNEDMGEFLHIRIPCKYVHEESGAKEKLWQERVMDVDWGAVVCDVIGKVSSGNSAMQRELFQNILLSGGNTHIFFQPITPYNTTQLISTQCNNADIIIKAKQT